jgi:hypothetical protein
MKLILQIAVGVFLGGIGVFLAIRTPGWMEQYRRNRILLGIEGMTPEQLVSRCGAPLVDKTEPFRSASVPGPLQRRIVYYKGVKGVGVAITFDQQEANDPFSFAGMRIVTPKIDNAGGRGEKITDDDEMMSLLPCLRQSWSIFSPRTLPILN